MIGKESFTKWGPVRAPCCVFVKKKIYTSTRETWPYEEAWPNSTHTSLSLPSFPLNSFKPPFLFSSPPNSHTPNHIIIVIIITISESRGLISTELKTKAKKGLTSRPQPRDRSDGKQRRFSAAAAAVDALLHVRRSWVDSGALPVQGLPRQVPAQVTHPLLINFDTSASVRQCSCSIREKDFSRHRCPS